MNHAVHMHCAMSQLRIIYFLSGLRKFPNLIMFFMDLCQFLIRMNGIWRWIRTALPISSRAPLVHSSGQNYVYGVSYKSKYAQNSSNKWRHSSSECQQHLCQLLISFPCELCTTNYTSFYSTLFIDSQMHPTAATAELQTSLTAPLMMGFFFRVFRRMQVMYCLSLGTWELFIQVTQRL